MFVLPAQEIKLNSPAEALLTSYPQFLLRCILVESRNSKDTERSEINSRFVTAREWLLRLVGHALNVEMNQKILCLMIRG